MTRKLVLGFSTIFILLQLILISYFNYIDFIDLQIITSSSLISDKSITIVFKEDLVPSVYELIKHYPDITLFAELHNNSSLQVWGLYGNCYLDKKTKSLIKGRFFQKNDFFDKRLKSVVGENVLNSGCCFEDSDGKKYFNFNNKKYEIIGSISSNVSKMLDNTAFINLDSFNNSIYKFVIDSSNSQSILTTINGIKKEYDVDIVSVNNNFVERYIFDDGDKRILNILVVFFIVILIIVLSVFTLCFYNEEIMVKRIIGMCFKDVFLNLLQNIILLIAVNTAFLVVIYAIIFFTIFQSSHLSFYFLPLIIFSIIILSAICLITYLYMFVTNKLFYKNGVR